MGNKSSLFILLLIGLLFGKPGFSQTDSMKLLSNADVYSSHLLEHIQKVEEQASHSLDKKTSKYLKKMLRQERKLKALISNGKIKNLAGPSFEMDSTLKGVLSLAGNQKYTTGNIVKWYSGRIDSMKTSLAFIGKFTDDNSKFAKNYNGIILEYSKLNDHLGKAEHIKKIIQERFRDYNERLTGLVPIKALKEYQKSVIYFKQSLTEYQDIYEHPEKLEVKVLSVLRNQPSFRKYFDKYSELGSIFRLPGQSDAGALNEEIVGLQSKRMVIEQINQLFGEKDKAETAMGKGIEEGQAVLNDVKNKIYSSLTTGESTELPGFRPNQQKTKTFLKRLDFGTNFQNNPGNALLPISTDIGVYVGYKLNSKSIVGIGASYKMGWGQNIKHITITHEGVGVRSYLDYRLKGGFWITGGLEYNFKEKFSDLAALTPIYSWQKSALIGIQKKYKVGNKNGSLSILYDFFWANQIPREQPIKFRMGFSLK